MIYAIYNIHIYTTHHVHTFMKPRKIEISVLRIIIVSVVDGQVMHARTHSGPTKICAPSVRSTGCPSGWWSLRLGTQRQTRQRTNTEYTQ